MFIAAFYSVKMTMIVNNIITLYELIIVKEKVSEGENKTVSLLKGELSRAVM